MDEAEGAERLAAEVRAVIGDRDPVVDECPRLKYAEMVALEAMRLFPPAYVIGREALGGFLWLARVADKGRAAAKGTIHDYIYPCPMDKGVFERWGITPAEFDAAMREHASDEALLGWLKPRVTDAARETA